MSRWMDGAELELSDIIKPTLTERVAVADNAAPRVQVRTVRDDVSSSCSCSFIHVISLLFVDVQ